MNTAEIEHRVIDALTTDIPASEIAKLLGELDRALVAAENGAAEARESAFDPTQSSDLPAAQAAMEITALRVARMQTLRSRLAARYETAVASEKRGDWRRRYYALKAKRDDLANELFKVYPEVATKLANLFGRIAENDDELSDLHRSRPAGVAEHLIGAEAQARGHDSFTAAVPSLAKELRLPAWDGGQALWPPPEVPFAVLAAAALPVVPAGTDWRQTRAAAAAARKAELERVADYYERQERTG